MYIVIMGGGKVGEFLAKTMLGRGNTVVVIESNREKADRLSIMLEGQYQVIYGDGCDIAKQEDAGIREADVFVAVTGHDDDNLVSCELAMKTFDVPRTIARVSNPVNNDIFRMLGIETISSTELIAHMVEEETMSGSMTVVSALSRGDIVLMEFPIGSRKAASGRAGISARSIRLPEGAILAAVDRRAYNDAEIISDDTILYPGDKAVVLADQEVIDEVRAAFKQLASESMVRQMQPQPKMRRRPDENQPAPQLNSSAPGREGGKQGFGFAERISAIRGNHAQGNMGNKPQE